jgi:predicted DNA-binding helix-hairpin-helix protein
MDAFDRLKFLSSQMHLEPAEDANCPQLPDPGNQKVFISQAVVPGGRRINLLKSLLTTACERDCYYCPFRAGRNTRRETFQPEEYARTFMKLHEAGVVEGAFISSGIINGGLRTQDKLLDTADILRNRLGYKGYLHLKIMPGVEYAQVERAMQLADRVSVNLEAPNSERLSLLAPKKEFMEELIQPLRWVAQIRRSQPGHLGWNGNWPSMVTQFVVGGAGETDLELLSTTERLYTKYNLRRAYFSAFRPIHDTPLEHLPAVSPQREHRLYQASFLLRDYAFSLEDLPFDTAGDLPVHTDPKRAWADIHLKENPVDIIRASREQLLRVPGIGPVSAGAILSARRQGQIRDLGDLGKLGVRTSRLAPFILLNGKRPAYQQSFW